MGILKKRELIYLAIALLTLLQIWFQPVLLDEAYYSFFASDVSMGYMDHPPMVAWTIGLSSWLGSGVVGLRLVNLIYVLGTLFFLDRLIESKSIWKYAFIFAFPVLHVLHLSIPDSALIFGTSAFFYLLKRYLGTDSWENALILGLSMVFMMYSKYHGVLTLLFSILFVLELFKRTSFYLLLGLVIVGMLPHLMWQLEYDFISLQYHFKERRKNIFEWHNVSDYLISSPFILSGLLVFVLLFKKRYPIFKEASPWTPFEKVMLANIAGFVLFFLYQSTKGAVEINWLFSASIPSMILLGNRLNLEWKWNKAILSVSLLIFFTIRMMLMTAAVPKVGYLYQYSGYENWSSEITDHADGLPIVFQDSYQLASAYSFHKSSIPFSFNTIQSRINQYSLSNNDDHYNGKVVKVYQLYSPFEFNLDSMHTSKGDFHYYVDSNFYVVNNLWVTPEEITLNTTKDSIQFRCIIENRGDYDLKGLRVDNRLRLVMSKRFSWDERELINMDSDHFTLEDNQLKFTVAKRQDETYNYKLGFAVDGKYASINSSLLKMVELK